MMEKLLFEFILPKNSKCIAMTNVDNLYICAAFDIPERGIELYVLNPNTGKTVKVEGWDQ